MMEFHLDEDIFLLVQQGIKDVEVRVNDEKRRRLKVRDNLRFLKRPLNVDTIDAKVKELKYYNNLEEVVDNYEMERIYIDKVSKEDYLNLMKRFYSDEEIKENGIVCIIFEK